MEQDMIEVGSVVVLNSGAPQMTVRDIVADEDEQAGWLTCTWWNGDIGQQSHFAEDTFRSECVTLITDDDEDDVIQESSW